VQAWAALRVFSLDGRQDFDWLERLFHKLLVNFTWWANREDALGDNVYTGGFLGLDNIGPIDRSHLPPGLLLAQADATAWLALYCLGMLNIVVLLAGHDPTYEDLAITFFEHFALIGDAFDRHGLWDGDDGFYYDQLLSPEGERVPVRARSFVGLMPIVAVAVLDEEVVRGLPTFAERLDTFLRKRPDLSTCVDLVNDRGQRLMAVVNKERLDRMLVRLVDTGEFWSGHGIRSLSKAHLADPVHVDVEGMSASAGYEPAESSTRLYGGNSNWRGPVWVPANLLLIDGLRQHSRFHDQGSVDSPIASLVDALGADLTGLFRRGVGGRRPVNAGRPLLDDDPRWSGQLWFHEYFHGDTGAGLGAEHQTGWTACIADILLRPRRLKPA
jgi:hypothetical protein